MENDKCLFKKIKIKLRFRDYVKLNKLRKMVVNCFISDEKIQF